MNRVLMVLAASAVAAVVMVGCNNGKCDASNCGGCCTADGQCVTGNSTSECGRRGEACTACSAGQTCATNVCVAGMTGGGGGGGGGGTTGGGGGTTGGGGGTTGGGTGGGQQTCTTIEFTTASGAVDLGGQFTPGDGESAGFHAGAMGKQGTAAGTFDVLGVELWYLDAPTVTFPYPVTLNGTTYNTCEGCVTLQTGCDMNLDNCSKFFLGQMGTVNYTAGTQNEDQGEFRANGMNINLVEWEFTQSADRAVPNGRCVNVTFNMVATWEPVDAGVMDAGMTVDAGTDAGMSVDAGTDAGTDAGLLFDAGIDAGVELDGGIELDAGFDAGITQP